MKKWILPIYLMGTFSLSANELSNAISTPLMSYADWRKINELAKCDTDLVIFHDGTKMCGRFDKIPTLKYSFGNLNFCVSEVAVISYQWNDDQKKVQYITKNGENYVGDASDDKLIFWAYEGSNGGPTGDLIPKKLDQRAIRFIIFTDKQREPIASIKYPLHSLETKNGNHLPVVLGGEPIHLHDGDRSFKIKTHDIVDISFNGGLHGYINAHGDTQELDFSFVQDKLVTVRLAKNATILQIPWDQVARIQGNNGGFNQENLTSSLNAQTIVKQATTSPGLQAVTLDDSPKEASLIAVSDKLEVPSPVMVPQPPEPPSLPLEPEYRQPQPALPRMQTVEPNPAATPKSTAAIGVPAIRSEINVNSKPVSLEEMINASERPKIKHEARLGQPRRKTAATPSEMTFQQSRIFESQNSETLSNFELNNDQPLEIAVPDIQIFDDFRIQDTMYEDGSLRKNPKVKKAHSNAERRNNKKLATKIKNETVEVDREVPTVAEATQKPVKKHNKAKKTKVLIAKDGKSRAFYIDMKPVTNLQYYRFVKATHHNPPSHWPNGKVPQGLRNSAVVNVSYDDAVAYAQWAGKKLPSKKELTRALKNERVKWDSSFGEWTATSLLSQDDDDDSEEITKFQMVYDGDNGKLMKPTESDPKVCFRCIVLKK